MTQIVDEFALDDDSVAKIGDALGSRGIRPGCPHCRRPRAVLNHLALVMQMGPSPLPCAQLLCYHCGSLSLFSTVVLGLRIRGMEPESESESEPESAEAAERPALDFARFAVPVGGDT